MDRRILETYHWLLVPIQEHPNDPLTWQELRLQGDEALAVRASRKVKNEELLITQFAGTRLCMELNRISLWGGDHVRVKQLWDDFARYPYLPRLRDADVLLQAIREGVGRLTWETETFAYAEGWDERRQRYLGLRTGQSGSVVLDAHSLVVKPEAARLQLDVDEAEQVGPPPTPQPPSKMREGALDGRYAAGGGTKIAAPAKLGRFHGAVELDTTRLNRDTANVAELVVQHLLALVNANVKVTLEIEADLPDGAPEQVVRTVTENCRTLKFTTFGFEET